MKRALLCTLPFLAVGCVVPVAAEPETEQAQAGEAPPVRCAYEVQAPQTASGALTGYFGPGVDCVPPEGGDAFTFGFAVGGDQIRLTAVRPPEMATQPPALYGNIDRTACVDWTGSIDIVDEDHWSVTIDATCVDDARLRVHGTWSGTR